MLGLSGKQPSMLRSPGAWLSAAAHGPWVVGIGRGGFKGGFGRGLDADGCSFDVDRKKSPFPVLGDVCSLEFVKKAYKYINI
jgi:hypothetical protein